ncbi:MAG TPA: CopD family protein, partial [Burkholderiales bacterium]
GAIGTVLTRTNFGTVWVFRLAGIGLLAAGFLLAHRTLRENRRRPEFRAGTGLLGALLLVSLAGAGHASGTDQSLRTFNVAADGLHLLAGGVWLGALVPLACVVGRARVSAASATAVWNVARRFSVLGMASVGSILATGVINAWLLVGRLSALVGTGYGRLLLLKLALFATMVAIAAVNRFRLTPRLVPGTAPPGSVRDAAARLRRNTVAELVLGTLIVLIVGALGIMVPPPHVHHH